MNWGITLGGNYFNSVDIIIFCFLMIGALGGLLTGFIESFSKTAGYVIGTISGLMFTVPLANLFMQSFELSQFLSCLIAFIVLFMIGFILVMVVASILHRVIDLSSGLEVVDRLLGFFWGFVATFAIIALICYALRLQKLFNVTPLFSQSQFITRIIDPHLPHALTFMKEKLN